MAFSFTDRKLIASVFIQSGYVLDFTDASFAEFFRSEFGIDIDQPLYLKNGTSKGNRLRSYFELADVDTAKRVLSALWEYLQTTRFADDVDPKHAAHLQKLTASNSSGPTTVTSPRPAARITAEPATQSSNDARESVSEANAITLFASYAHHNSTYDDDVLAIVQRLRDDGIDARSDHFNVWVKEGWPVYMSRELNECRFILVFASEIYKRRADGHEEPDIGLGVIWEYGHIRSELYAGRRINERFLPVGFGRAARTFVPQDLVPYTYFDLTSDEDHRKLLSVLRGEQYVVPRQLGSGIAQTVPKGDSVAAPVLLEWEGDVSFDYSSHNGIFVIGAGAARFETKWSSGSDRAIHCYNDPPSIESIAAVPLNRPISTVDDATTLDTTSRTRRIAVGQTVILKNVAGYFAALNVISISSVQHGGDEDRLVFRFKIAPDRSADFSALTWDDARIANAKRDTDAVALTNRVMGVAYNAWFSSSTTDAFVEKDQFAEALPEEEPATVFSIVLQLRTRGLLKGYPRDDDRATSFCLTPAGRDQTLHSLPDGQYSTWLLATAECVGRSNMISNWDIARSTAIEQSVVNHILGDLGARNLVTLTRPAAGGAGGARFFATSTALLPPFLEQSSPR